MDTPSYSRVRLALWSGVGLLGALAALPAILLGAPFWLMRAAVRGLAARMERNHAREGEIMRFDPHLGWRAKPGLDTPYLDRADVSHATTDEDGWPGNGSLEDSEVVAVSDSYGFGYGVGKGECFTELDPNLRIKALACPAYDLAQEVVALRMHAHQLENKLVLWFVYLENDIVQSLWPQHQGRRKPFVRQSSGEGVWAIDADHVRSERWIESVGGRKRGNFADLCSPSGFSERHFSALRHLVEEGLRACRSVSGTQLVVFSIPYLLQLSDAGRERLRARAGDPEGFDPDLPDQRLAGICEDLEIPFIPLSGTLEPGDYRRFDEFHWNARGHRKVSRVVARVHSGWRQGTVEAPGPTPAIPAIPHEP